MTSGGPSRAFDFPRQGSNDHSSALDTILGPSRVGSVNLQTAQKMFSAPQDAGTNMVSNMGGMNANMLPAGSFMPMQPNSMLLPGMSFAQGNIPAGGGNVFPIQQSVQFMGHYAPQGYSVQHMSMPDMTGGLQGFASVPFFGSLPLGPGLFQGNSNQGMQMGFAPHMNFIPFSTSSADGKAQQQPMGAAQFSLGAMNGLSSPESLKNRDTGSSKGPAPVSLPNLKRSRPENDGKSARSASNTIGSIRSDDAEEDGDQHHYTEESFGGEKRLVINFASFGSVGKYPQRIGKRNAYVPDGVSGRFKMYHENFFFRIDHGTEPVECRDGIKRVCIAWTVVNEPSGQVTSIVETPQDALRRQVSGKTICNRVYKEVLERRALSFEQEMNAESVKSEKNEVKLAHLASMVKLFRPKTFSLGPLAFGLLHTVIQERMIAEVAARNKEQLV